MLSKDQLDKLTTPRLKAYLRSWMKKHDDHHWDGESREIVKSSPEWQEHYQLIKGVLAQREHIW